MELVTSTDLVVTASLALILSFLIAKLVSFAITTDPKTTQINQLNRLCHVSVENKVHFQIPTNIETDHNIDEGENEEINVESKAFELSVTPAIAVVEVSDVREEFDSEAAVVDVVGSVDSVAEQRKTDFDCVNLLWNVSAENKVHFELPTNLETDHNANEEENEERNVESNVLELSVTPDIAVLEVSDVTEEFDSEADVVGSADSDVEKRKTNYDCVEETGVEKPSYVEEEEEEEEERDVVLDGDDWEGVERSELEKVFMAATEFVVGSESDRFGSDVEKELYGLHKIATEGPCRQSQPMPLMFSARAKWNAWQKLGNMNPEVAMEQYISLVSDKVPGWMKDTSAGMSEHEPTGSEIPEKVGADLNTSLSHQQMMLTDRELEQEKESSAQDHSQLTELDLENNVKK